ncbi:hypothetical protein I79_002143 [Cricetulus griseus]|uniref:Uncharacterized protein n=1 Tax=Cricetulus griseus TaxID=10029 RepID=G3GWL6_CRIGR|nr:hypothetical protein I79_002143 [Cricetulus griseus]
MQAMCLASLMRQSVMLLSWGQKVYCSSILHLSLSVSSQCDTCGLSIHTVL